MHCYNATIALTQTPDNLSCWVAELSQDKPNQTKPRQSQMQSKRKSAQISSFCISFLPLSPLYHLLQYAANNEYGSQRIHCHIKNVWMWWYFMCYNYCILMPRKYFLRCSFLKHDFWPVSWRHSRNEWRYSLSISVSISRALSPNRIVCVPLWFDGSLFYYSFCLSACVYCLTVALGNFELSSNLYIYTAKRNTLNIWEYGRSFRSLCRMMTMQFLFFAFSFLLFFFDSFSSVLSSSFLSLICSVHVTLATHRNHVYNSQSKVKIATQSCI